MKNSTNNILIISLLFIAFSSPIFAQTEANYLAKDILNSIQNSDTTLILKYIPSQKTLISYSKTLGFEKSKEEIKAFSEVYPKERKKFLRSFEELKNQGENLNINWSNIKFDKADIISKELKISDKENPITVNEMDIEFSIDNKKYLIKIPTLVKFENKWYLTGDKPKLLERQIRN